MVSQDIHEAEMTDKIKIRNIQRKRPPSCILHEGKTFYRDGYVGEGEWRAKVYRYVSYDYAYARRVWADEHGDVIGAIEED